MGFWRRFAGLSLLIFCTGAPAQTREDYEADFIFEESEPPPRRTFRSATDEQRSAAATALARFTSPRLRHFTGDDEFRRYVDVVEASDRARKGWWAAARRLRFAQADSGIDVQSDAIEPLCPPDDPECGAQADDDSITVTGSRVRTRNPSITNNQMRNVEEGDIVKQIDHHLLVLQDGRLFVVDTRAGGRRLALVDRVNVYRDPQSDMWYDEMLVFGDRILVTGYSYDEEETELAVFRLDRVGRLTRQGVFRLSSNDYYSSSNYATRLIGDSLVTYTPLSVEAMADSRFQWPIVRRWLPDAEADEEAREKRRGSALLDAASIYRPARTVLSPTVHTVSVCPLSAAGSAATLECRTTAFVGPAAVQWYVTDDQVYIWTAGGDEDDYRDECGDEEAQPSGPPVAALLYRVPVSGAAPTLIGVHGTPPDQFAMQADSSRFHALLKIGPDACHEGDSLGTRLSFFSVPLGLFSTTLAEAPKAAFTRLPSITGTYVASRFTDTHLVYGGLSSFRQGLPRPDRWDEDERKELWVRQILAEPRQPAYALAIDRPSAVRSLDVGHTVIRAERVADDIVLTGYRDRGGLMVTLIDLGGAPRIASQARLAGRYESEGRSHAFNSLVEPDGGGLMGLPTVRRVSDSGRERWRSRASDLSFLEFDVDGSLTPIGELNRRFDYAEDTADGEDDEDGVPGYSCEVSCIDWYGNSRPIFTDRRIFGLTGTELIEGRLEQGRIREVQRLNIALPKERQAVASAAGGSD